MSFLVRVFLTLMLSLAVVESVYAQGSAGKIKQIDVGNLQAVVVVLDSSIRRGDRLVATFKNKSQCFFTISVIEKSLATIALDDCESVSELRVGQVLDKSLIVSKSLRETESTKQKAPGRSPRIRLNEDFYVLFGLGASSVTYEKETQKIVDQLDDASGVANGSLAMDFFGFYWPVNHHKTMLGFVVNSTSEYWEGNATSLSVRQYLLGFSTHHFLTSNIGAGWFLRGDVGTSWYSTELEVLGDGDFEASSKKGLGVLVGGGYALPVSSGKTSLTGTLVYAHRDAGGETVRTTSLLVSFLF